MASSLKFVYRSWKITFVDFYKQLNVITGHENFILLLFFFCKLIKGSMERNRIRSFEEELK